MVVCATNSGKSAIITKKRGKDEIIAIPEIVERYRQFMIGIDMFDQNKTVINQAISGMDWIIKIENTKECIFCYYQKGKKSRNPYICSESKILLHPNCFYNYHYINALAENIGVHDFILLRQSSPWKLIIRNVLNKAHQPHSFFISSTIW
ncbi:unnamed protein product [Blepharisma stoltei]|uniref:Uncharacterized protein n=1 Tax=Blepharisma stoltei TaxID=1481888 RepID=A0AAU9K3T8_9CILI|nr:unnamed protein product [Blepharisma stoltei]